MGFVWTIRLETVVCAVAGLGAVLAVLLLFAAPSASATALDPVAAGVPGNGRAWELVTPPEPVSARLMAGYLEALHGPEGIVMAISPSGDRVAYRTAGVLPDANFGTFIGEAIAERGLDGWSNRALNIPNPQFLDPVWTVQGGEGARAFDTDVRKVVWQTAQDANHDMNVSVGPLGPPFSTVAIGRESSVEGVSADLDRVFFSSTERLLPADAERAGGQSIYEYDDSGLHLIDANEDGSLIDPSCGGLWAGISSNGEEAFFNSGFFCAFPNLYMRTAGHTVEVSASQCTLADCGPEAPASYLGTSPDGSAVFFASAQRLTDADNEGESAIYRYDVASGTLSQLYQQPPGSTASGFAYLVNSSVDGSRVYFSSEGRLLPGEGSESGTNLYVADGGGLHFVAPDLPRPVFVSGDGRYAVFATAAALDPGDTDSSVDVYRYDADSGKSTLISAGTGGSGNGAFDAKLPTAPAALPPPPSPAFDGDRRVVFSTAEPLLPQDRNDKEDVYEWTEGGGLNLISGGVPGLPGEFVAATPDGGTILFRTSATLLPRDRDGGDLDIYAARIGGGLPEPPEPAQPGCSNCAEGTGGGGSPRPAPLGDPDLSHRLELGPIDAAARRQLARTGATTLLVEVPIPGRLEVIGRDPGHRTVATGSARAKDAGPLRVRLRLEPAARRALARGERATVRLFLSLENLHLHGPVLSLKGARAD